MIPTSHPLEVEQCRLRRDLALTRAEINRAVRRPLTRINARRTADLIRRADDLTHHLRAIQASLPGNALETENAQK